MSASSSRPVYRRNVCIDWLENSDAVPFFGPLGMVHRDIGIAQNRVGGIVRTGVGDTDARGHDNLLAIHD